MHISLLHFITLLFHLASYPGPVFLGRSLGTRLISSVFHLSIHLSIPAGPSVTGLGMGSALTTKAIMPLLLGSLICVYHFILWMDFLFLWCDSFLFLTPVLESCHPLSCMRRIQRICQLIASGHDFCISCRFIIASFPGSPLAVPLPFYFSSGWGESLGTRLAVEVYTGNC